MLDILPPSSSDIEGGGVLKVSKRAVSERTAWVRLKEKIIEVEAEKRIRGLGTCIVVGSIPNCSSLPQPHPSLLHFTTRACVLLKK